MFFKLEIKNDDDDDDDDNDNDGCFSCVHHHIICYIYCVCILLFNISNMLLFFSHCLYFRKLSQIDGRSSEFLQLSSFVK